MGKRRHPPSSIECRQQRSQKVPPCEERAGPPRTPSDKKGQGQRKRKGRPIGRTVEKRGERDQEEEEKDRRKTGSPRRGVSSTEKGGIAVEKRGTRIQQRIPAKDEKSAKRRAAQGKEEREEESTKGLRGKGRQTP